MTESCCRSAIFVEQYEAEEELRTQLHYAELWKYVNSLLKVELQELYFDALVQLEEARNRY